MPERNINNPSAIAGAIAMMVLVPMFFLVMPVYVGALADDLGFAIAAIGRLISIELGAAALASLTALYWLRRVNWSRTLRWLVVSLCAANIASILVGGDYASLLAVRAFAGFFAGAIMAIAVAALGDTEHQDRNFAYGVVGQLSVSGILIVALPWFIERWGVVSVFALFLAAAAVALPMTRLVPVAGKPHESGTIVGKGSLAPLWGLLGSACIFIAQAAVWAFIERMGVSAGLSPALIGVALGGSVIAGIGGAFAASWLIERFDRLALMIVAMVGEIVCLLALLDGFSVAVYVTVVFLYSVFWNFWLPFQLGVIAEVDVSGRFVALITFSQATGIAIGPAIVAPFLGDENYDPVVWAGIIFAALAMLLFLPITMNTKRNAYES